MASSRCPAIARLRGLLVVGITASGCSLQPAGPAPDPGIALPAGIGRDVLLRACIDCHDLGGLELFAAFYTRADWRELVTTMVTHGAELSATEVELVADYLGTHFAMN
jgi:mono/diheme cytochrome c family protein